MNDDTWNNRCRCDGTPMRGSDHCPHCGCEELEERCEWRKSNGGDGRPWQEWADGEKWAQALRRGR